MTDSSRPSRIDLEVEPRALLSDLRTIARICREDIPQQVLEFTDHAVPVGDATTLDALERALDDRLGGPADARIAVSVPPDARPPHAEATTSSGTRRRAFAAAARTKWRTSSRSARSG
ncbi:TIGR04141 family sporadically distributed protein [Streptomyces sp. NPDC002935]|uniref:TIGR04141 family sporadically distributed protein n=1 Tax=Streptomyces sp. NPDC002935 TaxID=3154545 RepID=UPI00339F102A